MAKTLAERFREKVEPRDGCWPWLGRMDSTTGYGRIDVQTAKGWRPGWAHRVAWEVANGPIPDGKQIHHECGQRSCVNPAHLRLTTASEHSFIDPNMSQAVHRAKTHCSKGHEFTEENTRWYRGARCCRACDREHQRKRYWEKKLSLEATA